MLWGSAGQPAARAPTDATELTSEGERRWSEHHVLYRTTVGAAQHIWICGFRSGSRMKLLRVGLHCPLVARSSSRSKRCQLLQQLQIFRAISCLLLSS